MNRRSADKQVDNISMLSIFCYFTNKHKTVPTLVFNTVVNLNLLNGLPDLNIVLRFLSKYLCLSTLLATSCLLRFCLKSSPAKSCGKMSVVDDDDEPLARFQISLLVNGTSHKLIPIKNGKI